MRTAAPILVLAQTQASRLALAPTLLVALLAAPAHANDVVVRTVGTVSRLAPPPTTGPFAGAQVGDPVELRLEVFSAGVAYPFYSGELYNVDPSSSTLRIGTAVDALAGTLTHRIGIYDGWLGQHDAALFIDRPLAQGGHVRLDLFDSTQSNFASTDIFLLRGTYPASTWSVMNLGAQVGGGFIEMQVTSFEIGAFGPGSFVCSPAIPNSTGTPAYINGTGNATLAANALGLDARGLPLNTFGFFLVSSAQGNVLNPGGSQGRLCLGGAIGRYQNAVQSSGNTGWIALAIDSTQLPTPTGPVAAGIGETWTFQAWYRDTNPNPTSNFSDALAITFE